MINNKFKNNVICYITNNIILFEIKNVRILYQHTTK